MSFNTLKNKLDKYYYEDYINFNLDKLKDKYNEIFNEELDKIENKDVEDFNDYVISFDFELDPVEKDEELTKYNKDKRYVKELCEKMINYLLKTELWPKENIRIEYYFIKDEEEKDVYVLSVTLDVYEKLDSHGVINSD